jgi:hypothetical protein
MCAAISGDPYVFRRELRFEEKSLAGVFEQAGPMMVMAVDQPGDDNHPAKVNSFHQQHDPDRQGGFSIGPMPRMLSPSMRIQPLRNTSRLRLTVTM